MRCRTRAPAEAIEQEIIQAMRRPRSVQRGPATDDAIDAAIARNKGLSPPVELDQVRRDRADARPSDALLNSRLSRAARGT